jgi:NCS2 family nucleobase:cation symporter-2
MVIMAVALGLGLGVATKPEAIGGLPQAARTFFGQPVIMTALSALVLNTFVPGDQSPLFDATPEGPEDAPAPAVDDD